MVIQASRVSCGASIVFSARMGAGVRAALRGWEAAALVAREGRDFAAAADALRRHIP